MPRRQARSTFRARPPAAAAAPPRPAQAPGTMASPTYTEEITACLEIIQNLQARQPSPLTPELLKKAKVGLPPVARAGGGGREPHSRQGGRHPPSKQHGWQF